MFKKALAYARLLRLSNGPTALADVWMGYAVVSGSLEPEWPLVAASMISLCFYHGGMALNDAIDAERDAIENRGRPIAEGHMSRRTAFLLWSCLLLGGLVASEFVGTSTLVVTICLMLFIVAYNGPAKRTILGPPLMGACRGANGLLGMTAAGVASGPPLYAIPLGLILYITGVTLYARDEAAGPKRSQLAVGASISLVGVVWLAIFTTAGDGVNAKPIAILGFWAAVALMATRGMVAAILQPTSRNVGRGVGIAIQGLVVIDATLAALYAGPVAGLAILALLPVTMLLARWIPQT